MIFNYLRTSVLSIAVLFSVNAAVFAQNEAIPESMASARPSGHHQIVGMWDAIVTIRVCATGAPIRSFPALGLFNAGGTFSNTDTQNPATVSSVWGVWSRTGRREYEFAFKLFRFNPAGEYIGTTIVRQTVRIARSGDEYTSEGTSVLYDVNGNQIASGCSTTEAQRFQ